MGTPHAGIRTLPIGDPIFPVGSDKVRDTLPLPSYNDRHQTGWGHELDDRDRLGLEVDPGTDRRELSDARLADRLANRWRPGGQTSALWRNLWVLWRYLTRKSTYLARSTGQNRTEAPFSELRGQFSARYSRKKDFDLFLGLSTVR